MLHVGEDQWQKKAGWVGNGLLCSWKIKPSVVSLGWGPCLTNRRCCAVCVTDAEGHWANAWDADEPKALMY
jgi:hypothetical protein